MKKASPEKSQYIEALVFVPQSLVDVVSNYVTDYIATGVELKESESPHLVGIKFYVPAHEKDDFRRGFRNYLVQIVSNEMPQVPEVFVNRIDSKDWEDSYRNSIQPIMIENEICVRPPWAKAPPQVNFNIVIEPKMAFGTGHHETTRSCLRIIHKRFKSGQRFLDFGCGSGVLAILAAKMGAEYVKAVDIDNLAVENTSENFAINQVKCKSDVLLGSFDMIQNDSPYHVVCANLSKLDIITIINYLLTSLRHNGRLILSGILAEEQDEIERIFKFNELKIEDFIHESEWLTYSLNK